MNPRTATLGELAEWISSGGDLREFATDAPYIYKEHSRNWPMLQLLSRGGLDVNARTESGKTALMLSREVRYLLRLKPDVDAVDKRGHSAMWYAVYDEAIKKMLLLMDKQAYISPLTREMCRSKPRCRHLEDIFEYYDGH